MNAIPRDWLKDLIHRQIRKEAVEIYLREKLSIEPVSVSFDTAWTLFVKNAKPPTANPLDGVYWFESTSRSHLGLASVSGGEVVAYQAIRL